MIKPGVAKMSLNVMANLKNPLDLNIVPVGLEYSNYKRFRSDLLVKFGPAFKPAQVVEGNFDQGNAKAVRAIRDMVRKHLTEEVVHIEEQQFYDAFQTSREVAEPVMLESLKLKSGHYEEFQAFKRFVEKADSELKKDENRGQEFIDLTAEYEKLKNEHLLFEDEIRAYENKSYNKAWRTLALGLLWPIYALGFALNVLPMRITESFVSKNIKDPHFVSSIRVAVGAFAYLFYFIILGTTLALVFNFWLALLIISTTIMLGLFSLRYFEWMRSFGNYRRIEKLDTKIKDAFFNKRGKLLSLIKELTQTV